MSASFNIGQWQELHYVIKIQASPYNYDQWQVLQYGEFVNW